MAMTAGTVTIAVDGSANITYPSGNGLALALAQGRMPTWKALYLATYGGTLATASLASCLQSIAIIVQSQAIADAAALVSYIQANATAHVTTQSLGAVPSSTTHGTPIDAPASPVDVPIT